MNSLESLDQNPQEKELATLPWQQVAVLPVLNASSSSSVEKDGSLHRNIHSKLIFFCLLDQYNELNDLISNDPDEPLQPGLYHVTTIVR